jgi:hypothetical protein
MDFVYWQRERTEYLQTRAILRIRLLYDIFRDSEGSFDKST